MSGHINTHNRIRTRWIILVGIVVLSLLLAGCGGAKKTYTIGVINYSATLDPVINGLKAGMAELGYVEGENITYVYNGAMPDDQAGIKEIESMLAQDVDLLFTVGTQATVQAKQAVEGKDTPVIFAPLVNPVEEGVVASIAHPGGNVTGVQSGSTLPKALEWLLKLVPDTSKVYVFYNPKDRVSVTSLGPLKEVAATLGIELVLVEVNAPEEVVAAIATLPEGASIFRVPAPSITVTTYIAAATERGIAVGSYMGGDVDLGALVGYTTDSFLQGKQAARLTDQVFRGTAPADLPVETAEYFLSINLKTAQAIGLEVPDEFLRQADTVIR